MKILVIDDDKKIGHLLTNSLSRELCAVDWAENAEKGLYMFHINTYDLILLDYNLPDKNGKEILKEIRENNKKIAVIMLTIEGDQLIKSELFELGVDDYITKPFVFEDLLSRIKAVMRRPQESRDRIYKIDDLHVNIEKHRVRRGDHKIYLTFKELMLLEYFLKNQGRILSRTVIMENVWDFNADPFSNTIEAHILKIRRKTNPQKDKIELIHTIKGRGYKLDTTRW